MSALVAKVSSTGSQTRINFVTSNTKTVDQNIKVQVWLCYMKKITTITIKIKKEQGTEDKYSLELEKAHPTGEFVFVAKFGSHVLSFSPEACECNQAGRQAGRQAGKLKT